MNCCLLLSGLRSMECSEARPSSHVETITRTKLSQAMSKSLSLTVDRSENPLTLSPDYTKLPELNSDKDIEDVLCKISELLTSNSVVSSAPELNDSRSIEEILREAEEIVRDSSSYFEEEGGIKACQVEGCNGDASSDQTECSLELEQEQSRHGSVKQDDDTIGSDQGLAHNPNNQLPSALPSNGLNMAVKPVAPSNPPPPVDLAPLTLKDLDPPGRPTNLDLSLEVVHVESFKIVQNSIESKISLPPANGLNKPPDNSSLDTSEQNTTTNDSILTKEVSVINNHPSKIMPVSMTVKKSYSETNCSAGMRPQSAINKSKDRHLEKDPSVGNERRLLQLGIISADPVRRRQIPILHNNRPKSAPVLNVDSLKKVYEEKIFSLEQQIRTLSAKLSELEKSDEEERKSREVQETSSSVRLKLLEKEITNQEQLIAGFQRENQRLLAETSKARSVWLEAEKRLQEKVMRLERDLKRANDLNITEALELREALTDARQEINRLEEEAVQFKNEKRELEKEKVNMKDELKRMRNEFDKVRREADELRARDKERERRLTAEHSLASATLQGRLSQANTELTRKQTEVVRLTTEVTRLRGELERARLGSVVSGESPGSSHSASHQVRQLEVALERERDNSRRALAQLDSTSKHNLDLARQVKELETIVKRRSKCGSGISWGDEDGLRESLESRTRKLEQELAAKDRQLCEHQAKLSDLQNKYEKDVVNLQEKVRETNNKRSSSAASVRSNQRNLSQNVNSDAQLLATIRGLKAEVATKDKQLSKVTRELDDTRKKMSRTQSQHGRPLNNNRPPSNVGSKISESSSSGGASTLESGSHSSKNYNPFLFEEDRETMLFLRNENSNLHEEVKRLEQDLINLHNKRIQDLSELESNHSAEVQRALREQTARQANSQITHMRGQLYTQQMVINHLKNQIKVLEQKNQDVTVLKSERDRLEQSLVEANKKVATLHQLSSPESSDYQDLLEKLDRLERRHEVREAKLQTIVRELVARQQGTNLCHSPACKDKLYNKNREICYYRAEIDKILDSLTEFKYVK